MSEIDELQQLKEHCKFIDETNRILYQEKVDLIKENEELKEQLKEGVKVKMEWTSDVCKVCTFKQENEELRLELEVYRKSAGANIRKSLYEKLEKIKDIAEAIVYGTHITGDIEGHLKELTKKILQIIEGD